MALTTQQKATLKADILADPTLSADVATQNWDHVAAVYSAAAAPAFTVWRSLVTQAEIYAAAAFDWTRVDNLSVGKARIWEFMFQTGSVNAGFANIRAGIAAVWVGTAADLAVQASVLTTCKRLATRLEKLYATGTGTDVSPANLVVEGTVSPQTVSDAMGGL